LAIADGHPGPLRAVPRAQAVEVHLQRRLEAERGGVGEGGEAVDLIRADRTDEDFPSLLSGRWFRGACHAVNASSWSPRNIPRARCNRSAGECCPPPTSPARWSRP